MPVHYKGESIIGVIEYVSCLASFRTVNDEGYELPIHDDIRLEVVGNIYEI